MRSEKHLKRLETQCQVSGSTETNVVYFVPQQTRYVVTATWQNRCVRDDVKAMICRLYFVHSYFTALQHRQRLQGNIHARMMWHYTRDPTSSMNHKNIQDLNHRGAQITLTNFSTISGRIWSNTQSVITHFDIRLSIRFKTLIISLKPL